MFQRKVLDLPFLSPEANVYMPPKGVNMASAGSNVYEQYMMSQLATTGVPSPGGRATFSTDMLNREYAMIDSEGRLRHTLSGATRSDPNDKFYIPPGLFAGCYTVPHWLLPPLQRLSVFAGNSFRNIGYHLGVIHEPTFRLADAHAWLAFALCTAAGHKPFKTRTKWVEPEPWDAVQSVVRTEKTGMFVKLFARAGSKLPAAETFSGIQALLIYNAQSFLSENASDRLVGDIFLSTISKLARRSGVFDPDADWAKPNINISPDIGNDWVRWVRSESCRRTIWIVYLLDVQSSIESSAIPLVSPRDVRHLPIPTPDILWSAPNAVTWAMLISHPTFSVFTLDDAMQKLFDFSAEPENINKSPGASPSSAGVGSPALDSAGDATTVTPSVLDIVSLGPFARLVIVITILRGLIEYGEGNIRGGYVVQRWITGGQNGHFAYTGTDPELFHQSVMRAFSRALIRVRLFGYFVQWKNGWEFDTLCPKTPFFVNPESDARPIALFNQDAMPFYWMCQILLTHMSGGTNTPTSTPGPSGVMGPSPRRWVDEREDGEGQRRLVDIDLAATFATAKSVADPFTMGMDVNEAGFGV
ncbi:hypothetical protein DL93DRAFT_182816 [Clavulina sp. PMI_390]|nr:hypothetical protein DL93DRAFT_182816 [Clavulina sp. PMI_390]